MIDNKIEKKEKIEKIKEKTNKINKTNKIKYGEIFTPEILIDEMFNLFSYNDNNFYNIFSNKNLKWLDTGAGTGNFSNYLFRKLDIGLSNVIKNKEQREKHIIENMIYMVEINVDNINILKDKFGENANILHDDFLINDIIFNINIDTNDKIYLFDIIIGNPPYNFNGLKKTPKNKVSEKKNDGKTIWMRFVKKSLSILKSNGNLLYIIPSIWMKPDKENNYDYLLNYKIHKLHTLTNTETNKIFSGEAQTPTCFFILSNKKTDGIIEIYDKSIKKYIDYKISIDKQLPIPLYGQSVIDKLLYYVEKYGCLNVIKTNSPNVKSVFSNTYHKNNFSYKNVKTCILDKTKPVIIYNYSNISQAYYNIPKIILSHKMYGFPFIDFTGEFGISSRDNYVIFNYDINELKLIQKFLSTKTALYIYEATRYRMKYLEKYAFQLIPDITKLNETQIFPNINKINDETIAKYFNFTDEEYNAIINLHQKNYMFF